MGEILISSLIAFPLIMCSVVAFILFVIHSARRSAHKQRVSLRFFRDVAILKWNWWKVTLALLMITYGQIVCRNLAFILHHQIVQYVHSAKEEESSTSSALPVMPPGVTVSHRLHDLGFDLLPDMSGDHTTILINDTLQYVFVVAVLVTLAFPYILELKGQVTPVHTAHMLTRALVACGCGLFFRAPLYISTSLPGPALHCHGPTVIERRPKSAFSFESVGHNCGDLMYSGHMFLATTMSLCAVLYMRQMVSSRRSAIIAGAMSCFVGMQMLAVILSRSHYTVDVVVGVGFAIGNWVTLLYLWPHDDSTGFIVDSNKK